MCFVNRNLCHLQHKLIGFYNRDEKCLQRGTDWGFKWSGLRSVFKKLKGLGGSHSAESSRDNYFVWVSFFFIVLGCN
jgi:hypothetical protein